jgi:hypothetical protein
MLIRSMKLDGTRPVRPLSASPMKKPSSSSSFNMNKYSPAASGSSASGLSFGEFLNGSYEYLHEYNMYLLVAD